MINTKKKCIGLVLSFEGSSYGMNLQAFATQYIIDKLGYKTEIINYKSGFGFKKLSFNLGLLFFIPKILLRRYKYKKLEQSSLKDDVHKNNDQLRINEARKFRENMLHDITEKMTYDELCIYSQKYDSVLIGSDQGWLPGFSFGKRNSLNFVPKGIPRLSYATSLGVSSYPWYCYSSSRAVWKKFKYISVREESGRKIIQRICGDNFPVSVVIDPTYLLKKEEWDELIPPRTIIKERYALSFILGNNIEQLQFAKDFAAHNGLKLVSILSNESSSDNDLSIPDEVVIGAAPDEFINYIRGADFIFTDSFHGVAFSVINKKQFYVFDRKWDFAKGKNSRITRIENVLKLWKIYDRFICDSDLKSHNYFSEEIDYEKVDIIIDKERSRSLNYLRSILP